MIFHRIKSEGIAHNSYFIGSGREAAVIDPRRDCEVYIELGKQHGMIIRWIFETHRNEDYAIGSIELRHRTGAEIYHGPGLQWKYGNTLEEGQELGIGSLRLKALHTPGHTDEGMSYVVTDDPSSAIPLMVFTGDALFVNDIGRSDLYGNEEAPRLAASLYDSIFGKLLPLGDGVIICPAHGAGSVCGKSIADRDESTIGIEKIRNPWLQIRSREEFIKLKTAEKLERPHYFCQMEIFNLEGPPLLGNLPLPEPLTPSQFKEKMENGAIVVDTSLPNAFGGAHINGAYSIWLEGLPVFGGWVLPYDEPILLVPENNRDIDTAVRYLVRAGYDRIEGYLYGGTEEWYNNGYPVEQLLLLSVDKLHERLSKGNNIIVLDVREEDEWDEGHLEGAMRIYVGHLEEKLDEIPSDKEIAVMCTVGHRGGLAASILLKAGFEGIYNILGGFEAWTNAGYPVTGK
ncbi:MAG: MBL fold metallo-hydrolase [Dehalococcoidales bacterium]|nr:MAG: MBL fold metallo-hydrolase [Dehalococcoidales bacterium]